MDHRAAVDRVAIVDARHDGGVLVVIACRDGGFDRYVFRFDRARRRYDCRITRDVPPIGAVFTTTTTGICIARAEEGLEVFPAAPGCQALDTAHLPVPGDASLLVHDAAVLHVHGRTIDRLTSAVSR